MPLFRLLAGLAFALAALPARAQALPAEVDAALARVRLPREAVSMFVVDAENLGPPRVSHRAGVPVNPASIAKLATTFAALEILGPGFTWTTPVYVDGVVRDGVLHGNLYLKGQGDPKLVAERMWLLMRRVQGLGIVSIQGDIVLDQTAFDAPAQAPGTFDGEVFRPYNVSPDALLLNFKSVVLTFTPQDSQARVHFEPPMAGLQVPATVPLAAGACADWREGLKADFSDPGRIRFSGSYTAACGERVWPVAYADPGSFASRAIAGLWRQMGGALSGQVREGRLPPGLAPAFEVVSPPLTEVIRDINKFSNNVMAQQVFLTLSLRRDGVGTPARSRALLEDWWRERFGSAVLPTFDNGSGLSREARMTTRQLGLLLQAAWASPLMPELVASLPMTGIDGTLRRTGLAVAGRAHLKTGSLRDVSGVAGYVEGDSGKRYVLVAVANHPQAALVRPAIDALVEWTARDRQNTAR